MRLGPGKSAGPLGVPGEQVEHTIMGPQMNSVRFKAGDIVKIGGQHDGELSVDGEIPANSRCLIYLPVSLRPRKYVIATSFNPQLMKVGLVSVPPLLHSSSVNELCLSFQSFKKINLKEDFEYIFELFMID